MNTDSNDNPVWTKVKALYKEIGDIMQSEAVKGPSMRRKRLLATAMTETEGASLWAEKAIKYDKLF